MIDIRGLYLSQWRKSLPMAMSCPSCVSALVFVFVLTAYVVGWGVAYYLSGAAQ